MILCCGEALMDMLPDGDAYVPYVGGAVFNTAVALGRLDAPVALVTGLSSDGFGQKISNGLAQSNVRADLAVQSDRPTTLAMVHLTNGQAQYSFYDSGSALRDIAPSDLPPVPDDVQALFFGGISLCNPPVADTLAGMAADQPPERVVMVDPNIRPGFADDEVAYCARLERVLARANIVKVSDDDLHWIVEGDAPLDAKARTLIDKGPTLVLVTRGGDGATAYCASGVEVSQPAEAAQVVDTIGAGDTFNAGCLFALWQAGQLTPQAVADLTAEDLTRTIAFAARAAAITVSRAGANPPWATDLDL